MAEPLRAIGYHGTSTAVAHAVLRDGFKISRNIYDWLGDGVYFFQDAPNRAREWARQRHGDDGVVVRSIIRLEDCLDLLDIEWNDTLMRAYRLFVRASRRAGQDLPRQSTGAHRLDRAVVNYAVRTLARENEIVRAVRGVFAEGAPVFPGLAIMDRAHVQIAVRDASLIESIELLGAEGR